VDQDGAPAVVGGLRRLSREGQVVHDFGGAVEVLDDLFVSPDGTLVAIWEAAAQKGTAAR